MKLGIFYSKNFYKPEALGYIFENHIFDDFQILEQFSNISKKNTHFWILKHFRELSKISLYENLRQKSFSLLENIFSGSRRGAYLHTLPPPGSLFRHKQA